jgi:type II secretory pathway component PulK
MKIRSARRPGALASRMFLRAAANERGVALMIVLWVMTLLMIIVSEFAYTMKVEGAAVRNFKDEAEAYYLASAGVNMALAEISESYDLVCLGRDGALVFKKKEKEVLQDIKAEREALLGGGKVFYTVTDEKGKININSAARETISDLLRVTGVEAADRDIIADSVLDWRDPNQEHHMNGAETDYYSSLLQPYAAKDGPLDMVEELLLVQGVTPEIFYGAGKVPPELGSRDGSSGWGYKGISRHLTVRGDGMININTADESVLEAALGKGKAQEILLRRATEGFYEMPAYGGAVTSDAFLIRSIGEVRGMRVGITAVAERKAGATNPVVSYWKEEGITPD